MTVTSPSAQPYSSVLIEARHVSVAFGGLRAVDHVDLAVRRSEIVSLIGPNGSGKTTLIRALLGLQKLSAGEVWRAPGLRVGYVPQRISIDPALPLTAGRFLAMSGARRRRIREVTAGLGVEAALEKQIRDLSGGEWQRCLLARAILRRPDLLVLDEPAQGVDVIGQNDLYSEIRRLRDELGCGVLLVSHDLHLVMASTDQVYCLNGHVCCTGQPDEVTRDPAYVELFGEAAVTELAIYQHHHDHVHGPQPDADHPEHGGRADAEDHRHG